MSKPKDNQPTSAKYKKALKVRLIESRAKHDGIIPNLNMTAQGLEKFIEQKKIPLSSIRDVKLDKGLRSQAEPIVKSLYDALDFKEPSNIVEKLIMIAYRSSEKLTKDISPTNIGFGAIFDYAKKTNKTLDHWIFGFGTPATLSNQDRKTIETIFQWEAKRDDK